MVQSHVKLCLCLQQTVVRLHHEHFHFPRDDPSHVLCDDPVSCDDTSHDKTCHQFNSRRSLHTLPLLLKCHALTHDIFSLSGPSYSQKVDINFIQRRKCIGWSAFYPPDSDLSTGKSYLLFEQPEPDPQLVTPVSTGQSNSRAI